MNFDMRGLNREDRMKLLAWFISNYPVLEVKGRYKAFKYLNERSKDETNAEFVANAMKRLMDEGEEEDDIINNIDELEALYT